MAALERVVPGEVSEKAIERLVRGSIDMHAHFGPDPQVPRRTDAALLAKMADELEMAGVVLKSHDFPTGQIAATVTEQATRVKLIGSIVLNSQVGGLNPEALEASARIGARVVWFPTLSSANDKAKLDLPGQGIGILDGDGKVLPVVEELLSLIKEYEMVLATGHVSVPESLALVEAGRMRGLKKVVVTHPLVSVVGATMSLEEQKALAEKGAFIEHIYAGCSHLMQWYSPGRIAEAVAVVGAERTILSTDFGLAHNPPPPEGMRMIVAGMLSAGLTEQQVERMVKVNPARLLDMV